MPPRVSAEHGTLFEHCLRAIDRGLTAGAHGLPLIGTGDWNDGMNRVGQAGPRREQLARLLPARRARPTSRRCARRAATPRAPSATAARRARLGRALELAWDGEWYRRGYFDDGTPLGSAQNDECKIDSIAQSWAVLSGAVPRAFRRTRDGRRPRAPRRARLAAAALLDPPFDRSAQDPGYIKGYPPGVRENGGQYTHAAVWAVMALARLGQRRRGRGAVPHAQPDQPHAHGRRRRALQGRALRAGRRRATRTRRTPAAAGWTWYTGSAGWMYRAGLESILGLRRRGASFSIDPCIPTSWPEYGSPGVRRDALRITVLNPDRGCRGVASASLDGREVERGRHPAPSRRRNAPGTNRAGRWDEPRSMNWRQNRGSL